jgi:hypothetical protein
VQENFARKLVDAGFQNVGIPYQHQRIGLGGESIETNALKEPAA